MASRPTGYGMTAELAAKKDAKFDQGLCGDVCAWIDREVNDSRMVGKHTSQNDFHEALKDGVTLCHLANALKPGSVKKINESKMAFKQMENIGNFLVAAEAMGVNKLDLFQTVDLYEGQNIPQVINGLFAVGRKFNRIGPKESQENKREFTDEQRRAGDSVIGLQMGSNKGASQAGQSFGKNRQILD